MPIDANIDETAIQALLSDVGAAALARLAGIFAEECDRNCREINGFLAKKDFSGSEIVAHRFKSTARQFGAHGLSESCQELERACAAGHGEDAHAQLATLILLTPRVLGNLSDAMASVMRSS